MEDDQEVSLSSGRPRLPSRAEATGLIQEYLVKQFGGDNKKNGLSKLFRSPLLA